MDSGPTDAELVALARLGDKDAFGQLADRYMPLARRLAQRMVARDGLADDVMQEALLQAYLSLRHLKDFERFRSWFYGIVLNVCRGELRALNKDVSSFADLAGGADIDVILSDAESSPHAMAEQQEATASLLSAIKTLPPKDRRATLLFYFEAFSVREVAESLGISEGAVRVHLHSARTSLRERLTPDSIDQQTQLKSRKLKRRRKDMVSVSIADVIELTEPTHRVIVLLDEATRRALMIWVGDPEAAAIVRALRNVSTPRPLQVEFTANLLKASGTTVERVHITTLKAETFYATVALRTGKATSEVDARPSDALALAVLMKAPIFLDEAILAGQGEALSEAQVVLLGRGLDAFGERLAREILATMQSTPATDASEEDWRYAEELLEKQEVIESMITVFNKGGVIVNVGRLHGFVPMSQLSLTHQRMLSDESLPLDQRYQLIGQKMLIKVIEIDREHNRLILSELSAQV